ncbi:type I-E CRISPR-associated protein Cas6/Cse3/CasE [Zavarzinia compransoris]|uniref:type I-E CRISPR-associated protein Cas6/Cse3/CasE n=1 Tax=Zavarzinia compransoris TaxID=1264899 RepID=UPI0010E87B84|nr:type I-E CRISPR-associated protein Cas6/Cse3/CasE [Zavarzinia compransoris]TDP48790.1 CRISPR system Cascade subunit CasE [Zavarzinia compransoris]
MTTALHMLQLALDGDRLARFGAGLGLDRRADSDGGYLCHALLTALFGAAAPKPFVLQVRAGGGPSLLAYAPADLPALAEIAALHATPDVYRIVDWPMSAAKPMPVFRPGQRLAFTVRVRPVVRIGRQHPCFKPGAEVDIFLARAEADRDGPKPDREDVYRQWLAAGLTQSGAALEQAALTGQRRTALLRRNAEGKRVAQRQQIDADLAGTLTVTEPEGFRRLVARGIGRHRAFGFGMLLLRPAA